MPASEAGLRCAACHRVYPKTEFSKKQASKTKRKCIYCIMQKEPPPSGVVVPVIQQAKSQQKAARSSGKRKRTANARQDLQEERNMAAPSVNSAKKVALGNSTLWYLDPEGQTEVGSFTDMERQREMEYRDNSRTASVQGWGGKDLDCSASMQEQKQEESDVFCRVDSIRFAQVKSVHRWFMGQCASIVQQMAAKRIALSAACMRWMLQCKFLELYEQNQSLQYTDAILPQTRECQRDMFLANELIEMGVSPEATVSLLYDLGNRTVQAVREHTQKQFEEEIYIQKQYKLALPKDDKAMRNRKVDPADGGKKNIRVRTRDGEWAWVFAPPRLRSGFFRRSPLFFPVDADAMDMYRCVEENEVLELSMKGLSFRVNKSAYKTMQMKYARLNNARGDGLDQREQRFQESLFCVLARYCCPSIVVGDEKEASQNAASTSSLLSSASSSSLTTKDPIVEQYVDVLGWSYSLHNNVFRVLQTHLNCSFELFASPLDAHFQHYFSAFPGIDGRFGSLGNFFDGDTLDLANDSSMLAHPPWDTPIIQRAAIHRVTQALKAAEGKKQCVTVVYIMTLPPKENGARLYESCVENWEILVRNELLRDQLVLKPGTHGYVHAHAWQRPAEQRTWTSNRLTGIFVMQTEKAKQRHRVTDVYREAMREAFAVDAVSLQSISSQRHVSMSRGLDAIGWVQ